MMRGGVNDATTRAHVATSAQFQRLKPVYRNSTHVAAKAATHKESQRK